MKREIAADMRAIFNAPDQTQTEIQLRETAERYARSASKLADWLEAKFELFFVSGRYRRKIHTVNSLERVCLEIRRRTRMVDIFSNGASCLRLASALLMEVSETWETGRIYLSFERH